MQKDSLLPIGQYGFRMQLQIPKKLVQVSQWMCMFSQLLIIHGAECRGHPAGKCRDPCAMLHSD